MKKDYNIRWSRSDYKKLEWAVRKFNENKRKLETEENKLYLPEEYNYKELKEKIFTRQEFNRMINRLNRFSKESEQKFVKTEMGEPITNWELKELKKEKVRAQKHLVTQLIEVREQNTEKRLGFKTADEIQLQETIESLEKLNTTFGRDFREIKERIHRRGNMDYGTWRNSIYRENYYEGLKNFKNYKNYKIFKNKLDSIKNPNEFYEYIQSNEIMSDMFLRYGKNGLQYGAFASDEDAFDSALEQLGLIKG